MIFFCSHTNALQPNPELQLVVQANNNYSMWKCNTRHVVGPSLIDDGFSISFLMQIWDSTYMGCIYTFDNDRLVSQIQ